MAKIVDQYIEIAKKRNPANRNFIRPLRKFSLPSSLYWRLIRNTSNQVLSKD